MTEEEAKEKWCPLGNRPTALVTCDSGVNRDKDDGPATFCIGAQCMAWGEHGRALTATDLNGGYCKLMEDDK